MQQVWAKIVAFLEAASKQRHMVALRDGMIGSVPIILVGSTFLLLGAQSDVLAYIPGMVDSAFFAWYKSAVPMLLLPYRFTMGLLALYVAFTIAAALAKEYELPPIPNGLTAMACLLISGEMVRTEIHEGSTEWVLAVKPLGAEGLFLAILLGLCTVEISRHLTYMPKPADGKDTTGGIPPAVVQAFASFLPMLTCVFAIWLIRHALGFDIHQFIIDSTQWMKDLGDTFVAMLVVNVFLHLFGVAGVHGISVINAAMLPIWLQFLTLNAEAHAQGVPLPYVTAFPFYQWFIWIGGAGATLAPTVHCLFSRNAHIKRIGRVSIVPAIFNINEPLLFGLPVVANPVLAIPFILAPLVCGTVAYFATAWGMVGKAFIEAPWVMPCFLGAYLSTSDVRAVLLLLVNFALSYMIWAPFLKAYERRLAASAEAESEERGGLEQGDVGTTRPAATADQVVNETES